MIMSLPVCVKTGQSTHIKNQANDYQFSVPWNWN